MAPPDVRSPVGALERLQYFMRLQRGLAKTASEVEVWDVALKQCAEALNELNDTKLALAAAEMARFDLDQMLTKILNRRVKVEQVLAEVAAGKRGPLSKDECHELACVLGVPDGRDGRP